MHKNCFYSFFSALCAAIMVMGFFPEAIKASQVFKTEQIIEAEQGTLNGVIYYNDSSASDKTSVYINPGAVLSVSRKIRNPSMIKRPCLSRSFFELSRAVMFFIFSFLLPVMISIISP